MPDGAPQGVAEVVKHHMGCLHVRWLQLKVLLDQMSSPNPVPTHFVMPCCYLDHSCQFLLSRLALVVSCDVYVLERVKKTTSVKVKRRRLGIHLVMGVGLGDGDSVLTCATMLFLPLLRGMRNAADFMLLYVASSRRSGSKRSATPTHCDRVVAHRA
jgi:hypothetical protein